MGPGQRTLEHCQPEEGLAARSRLPTALLPSTAGTPKVSSLENTVSLASHKTEEIFFFLPDLMGNPGSERFDNFPQGHTAEAWEIKRDSKAYVL